jgi:hypothetical protein
MLMLDPEDDQPRPNKTVPAHFAPVDEASAEDVERVFGAEDEKHLFLGTPLDMESVHVNLDLERFVERSSGVFGKSGTGKSFITRILLAGIIRAGSASALIFDMHNDYVGGQGRAPAAVHGPRQLFTAGQVRAVTLMKTRPGARKVDRVLGSTQQLEPEDVEMLSGLLGLSDVQTGALPFLRRRLGPGWIDRLLSDGPDDELASLVEEERIVSSTLGAIQRNSNYSVAWSSWSRRRRRCRRHLPDLKQGQSVVWSSVAMETHTLHPGSQFLTRRIHERHASEERSGRRKADEPQPLVIVIEEAHKFLDPSIAGHTVFGNIARELRKYNVTLLIVDQRPSGIDDEVMSQIGTRVTCLLDNEADIRAVFSGVSGAGALREVLARLDTRQQALILGHAVPMPVVVRTRDYDESFYRWLGAADEGERKQRAKKGSQALFGE